MRKNRGITAAIEESTAAREALTEKLRARDFNGFTPDEDREETLLNPPADPALRAAWFDGYMAAVGILAARARVQLDAVLERAAS